MKLFFLVVLSCAYYSFIQIIFFKQIIKLNIADKLRYYKILKSYLIFSNVLSIGIYGSESLYQHIYAVKPFIIINALPCFCTCGIIYVMSKSTLIKMKSTYNKRFFNVLILLIMSLLPFVYELIII